MTAEERALAAQARLYPGTWEFRRQQSAWLDLADTIDSLCDRLEAAEAAIAQPHHVLILGEERWALEHVLACRQLPGGMTSCPLLGVLDEHAEDLLEQWGQGRYAVQMVESDSGPTLDKVS